MKTKHLLTLLFCVYITSHFGQSLGEFTPKKKTFGMKKLRKNPKKIYIANFAVNIQVYKDAQQTKSGDKNYRKGKVTGSAKAVAAVGIGNLDKEIVQEKVNLLYDDYVKELKTNGFEIINANEAKDIDSYRNWEKAVGPFVIESKIPGVITIVPKNYSFYYKNRTKIAKKFRVGANVSAAISKDLDNALISDVQMYFLFTEDGAKDWLSGKAAKVKIKVNYRLINSTAITSVKKHSGLLSMGKKTFDQVASNVNFTQGKNKIGGSAISTYSGFLKNDLEISGVIKKEKIVAYQKQDEDRITSFKNFALAENRISKNVKLIDVDSKAFSEGFYLAGKKFLFHHLNELLENYN